MSYVEYTIKVDDAEISDFTRILKNDAKDNLTKEHEYVLIGGVAGQENTVKLDLYDKNNELYRSKEFQVTLPELDEDSDYILKKENGTSSEVLSDGLFATMGHVRAHINPENKNTNTYYYDNDGVARAQINLDNYRVDRILIKDNLMYISVDTNKIAALDRLGSVVDVYDLGKYVMHHDYIFDNNGNILILVSDTESDTVEDKVVCLSLEDKSVTEIIDLGKLLPEKKAEAVWVESKDKLDWIHVNSIELLGDSVLLSAREESTIIKVSDIYKDPKVDYLIGDEKMWENTPYKDDVLKKEGDFEIHAGQHCLSVVEDDRLPKGQYYLYFYNNNTCVSSYYPDYDWSYIKDIDTDSSYYEYLVDENNKTYSLVKEISLEGSRYISSVQQYKDHIIADSGNAFTIYELDSNDELISKFIIEEKMWGLYRVFKHDFNDFYFKAK